MRLSGIVAIRYARAHGLKVFYDKGTREDNVVAVSPRQGLRIHKSLKEVFLEVRNVFFCHDCLHARDITEANPVIYLSETRLDLACSTCFKHYRPCDRCGLDYRLVSVKGKTIFYCFVCVEKTLREYHLESERKNNRSAENSAQI